jgi:DNA-binding MarR family transcriptional regulator
VVARRAHPTDRRAFEVHLLDAGRDRLRSAEAISEAATGEFFAALTPEERQLFHQLLLRLAVSNVGKLAHDRKEE